MSIDIATLIGQYAFPIVACVVMAWYVKYTGDQSRADLNSTRSAHEEEIEKLTEAVNNNTRAIEKLLIYIGGKNE